MNSREKGKRGEREVAAVCRYFGYDARRGQQYCGIDGAADVIGLPGFHVEVKYREKLNIDEALAKTTAEAKGKIPIVVHKRNGEKLKVTMWFDANFFDLVREYIAGDGNLILREGK